MKTIVDKYGYNYMYMKKTERLIFSCNITKHQKIVVLQDMFICNHLRNLEKVIILGLNIFIKKSQITSHKNSVT